MPKQDDCDFKPSENSTAEADFASLDELENTLGSNGAKIVLSDSLFNHKSAGIVNGGEFLANGYHVIGLDDRIVYDLGCIIHEGEISFTVRNFDPFHQIQGQPWAHFMNLSTRWSNHHANDNADNGLVIHAGVCGKQINGGKDLKLLTWNYGPNGESYGDEQFTQGCDFKASSSYQFRFVFNQKVVYMYVNGQKLVGTSTSGKINGRFLCIGSDTTISGTHNEHAGPGGNRYPALGSLVHNGPIYSSVVVKATKYESLAVVEDILTGSINPIQDTYVLSKCPYGWGNDFFAISAYGLNMPIALHKKDLGKALLKFDVHQYKGKVIKSAKLRLMPRPAPANVKGANITGFISRLPDNTFFDETKTTWRSFKHPNGTIIGYFKGVSPSKWIEIPLEITKLETFLVLQIDIDREVDPIDNITLESKESELGYRPQLVIQV